MRITRTLFLIAGLVLSLHAQSQQAPYTDFNNYSPVYCSGEIPSVFLMSVQDKYKADYKEEVKTSRNKNVSRTHGEFLLQSNFFIDVLLQSGKVMFGDSVTNYVNTVADRVLINEPELREKLTFYCLRSEEPNAFSTDQGIIFVTLGLIAQLENEAQLAFVLSHEIAHYEKRHTLNIYMERHSTSTNGRDHGFSIDDKIRQFSNHEKANEFEADELGLARLSRTGYDCSEAIGAMYVLQFAHLPFEDYDFPVHSFERPMMAFPADLFLNDVTEISLDGDEEDDDYSSHPNIASRRARLEGQLEGMGTCGTEKFASPQSTFEMVRTICRYEVIRMELISRNYPTAIYNATYLMKAYPNSLYLQRTVAKAMYCMAKYKNESEYNDGTKSYGAVEGKQQVCFYFLQRMDDDQLTAVALRTLYDLSLKDSSAIVKSMLYDLCTDAVYFHKMTLESMKKSIALYKEAQADTQKTEVAPVKIEAKDSTSTQGGTQYVSKYDKLKNEKKKKEQKEIEEDKVVEKSKFHMLAFADIIDDPRVIALFKAGAENAEARTQAKELADQKYAGMSSYEQRKARQKEARNDMAPAPLGIDTLLVVDPFYFYATEREGYKMEESEDGRYRLCDQITNVADAANLEVVLFSMKEFKKDDIDKYNELAILNDWIEESAEHDDFVLIQSETEFARKVCDKYHADNIMLTGVVTVKQKRENRGTIMFFSIICYPLLPVGLVWALTPEHETYLISGIYNVETSQEQMTRVTKLKAKARNGYIGSQLFDIFLGIQQEPETAKKKRR